MKTFYIFKLKKEIYLLCKRNPYNIYLLFNTIYRQNKRDLIKAFNLFDEICLPINKDFFNDYFFNKFNDDEFYSKFKSNPMYYNYFDFETSKVIINKSFMLIKSNKIDNIFVESLVIFPNLFLCNFKDNYYKLITNSSNKMKLNNLYKH